MRSLFVVAGLAALAFPAVGHAATVTGNPSPTPRGADVYIRFAAAPGEANDLTVTVEGGAVRFRDVVPIELRGTACRHVSGPSEVLCERPLPGSAIVLELGDGDDRLATDVSAELGPGDDEATLTGRARVVGASVEHRSLRGGPGDDVLVGSPDSDGLSGDGGADVIRGEGGDDLLWPADIGRGDRVRDLLDGGDGIDRVSYSGPDPVHVDLTAPAAGEDDVRGVEDINGGSGNDILIGGPGANKLDGGLGDDRVEGRDGADALSGGDNGADVVSGEGGDDTLWGGVGADVLDGGEGIDLLYAVDQWPDVLRCGPGDDTVELTVGEGTDGTCERAVVEPLYPVLDVDRLRRGRKVLEVSSRGWISLAISCVRAVAAECNSAATLRAGGRRIASTAFRCRLTSRPCEHMDARLRLPAELRRRVRRRGGMAAVVVVPLAPGAFPVTERVWLRPRPR